MERYKTLLVAKDFSQEYDIDNEENITPVAKLTTIHTMIEIAYVHRWKISQMDVKNALLYGDLHEEVHMTPSSWCRAPTGTCLQNPPSSSWSQKSSLSLV